MRRVEMIVGGILFAPKALLWLATFCFLAGLAWLVIGCIELWEWAFGDE